MNEIKSIKKSIDSLFKNSYKKEKILNNEIKEILKKQYYDLLDIDNEGKLFKLFQEYEHVIPDLNDKLKPILKRLKNESYKKEIILFLRQEFKLLRKVKNNNLKKIVERLVHIGKENGDFILLKAKMNYGILWHGTIIKDFLKIIKSKYFKKPLFLSHSTQAADYGGPIHFLINIKGLPSRIINVTQKEVVIPHNFPLNRCLEIYCPASHMDEASSILKQNNVNIPIFSRNNPRYIKNANLIQNSVKKLYWRYINHYKKLGLKLKNYEERIERGYTEEEIDDLLSGDF